MPIDAAARSDSESVYEEMQPTKPKKKQAERQTTSKRVTQPASTGATLREEAVQEEALLPLQEPIYLPLTASGLPVLTEAANKRLVVMKAEAERKRLEDEAKSSRKKVPAMRSKSSRALTTPFGMPLPNIVGAHEDVSTMESAGSALADLPWICSSTWTGHSGYPSSRPDSKADSPSSPLGRRMETMR